MLALTMLALVSSVVSKSERARRRLGVSELWVPTLFEEQLAQLIVARLGASVLS
jgi:hypothetical protein